MRRLLIIPFLIALTGCAGVSRSVFDGGLSITATVQNPVTREMQASAEASYNVVASAAVAYVRLPRCKAGTVIGVDNLCSSWPVVQKLKTYNRVAYTALVKSRGFVDNNQNISAIGAYNEAVAALRDFKAIAFINGIKAE